MEQELTLAVIRARFEDEWVLIGDPETDEALEVLRGKILHHSKDRDEVYRQAVARHPRRCAIVFTGQIPADTAVVL
jgi:hypothetical protein